MTIGAASPLCYTTWLFAAYMSSAVAGFADDASVSSGPSGRPSGRRLRRRNASSKRLAGASWSVKTDSIQFRSFANVCMGAPCGSGISGLGSYLAFESRPEDDGIKNEPLSGDVSFFGAGLSGLKTRPVQPVRRPLKATTGEEFISGSAGLFVSFVKLYFTYWINLFAPPQCSSVVTLECSFSCIMHHENEKAPHSKAAVAIMNIFISLHESWSEMEWFENFLVDNVKLTSTEAMF